MALAEMVRAFCALVGHAVPPFSTVILSLCVTQASSLCPSGPPVSILTMAGFCGSVPQLAFLGQPDASTFAYDRRR